MFLFGHAHPNICLGISPGDLKQTFPDHNSNGVFRFPLDFFCLAYISQLTPKSRMICRLTPKSCLMYAGLRLAKTFVFCCPGQLNKRLADSKIESVRRLFPMYARSKTFVVASSQSQRVAFMTRSARIAALKLLLCSVRASKTFVAQCTRYLNICILLLYCHTKAFVG